MVPNRKSFGQAEFSDRPPAPPAPPKGGVELGAAVSVPGETLGAVGEGGNTGGTVE